MTTVLVGAEKAGDDNGVERSARSVSNSVGRGVIMLTIIWKYGHYTHILPMLSSLSLLVFFSYLLSFR